MQVFTEIALLRAFLAQYRNNNKTVGLVPTMGALHAGHLRLIEYSLEKTDLTVCSVFVNPAQFNNPADLANYPRTPAADLALLEEAGCQVAFLPQVEEIYPTGGSNLTLAFGALEQVMEGPNRPGHFSGVGLVVSKLFNIVQPNLAFFGQKDWQQCQIINALVHNLCFPVELHFVPTLREASGLALSSRNVRLSAAGRRQAAVLYQALTIAAQELQRSQNKQLAEQAGHQFLQQFNNLKVEYLTVAHAGSLQTWHPPMPVAEAVICLAAWLEGVRLIDNVLLNNFQN